jgi:hypothetical protein
MAIDEDSPYELWGFGLEFPWVSMWVSLFMP